MRYVKHNLIAVTQMLNALAGAAVGWDENRDGNDELFHAVEGVVQRELKDFDKKGKRVCVLPKVRKTIKRKKEVPPWQ